MATNFRAAMVEQVNELSREHDRLRTRLNSVQGRPPTAAELMDMTAYQARADAVYSELGMRAPRWLSNESADGYRRRLLSDLAQFSRWRDAKISVLPASALAPIEQQVWADAQAVAANPTQGDLRNPEQLRRVEVVRDGVKTVEYRGDPGSWMSRFVQPSTLVRSFAVNGDPRRR